MLKSILIKKFLYAWSWLWWTYVSTKMADFLILSLPGGGEFSVRWVMKFLTRSVSEFFNKKWSDYRQFVCFLIDICNTSCLKFIFVIKHSWSSKGQLISECPFDVFFPKTQRKNLTNFCSGKSGKKRHYTTYLIHLFCFISNGSTSLFISAVAYKPLLIKHNECTVIAHIFICKL